MDLSKADNIIQAHQGNPESLVMILQDIQEVYNYLPTEILQFVSERLEVGLSRIFSVATFYASFSLVERGKHVIRVCDGTACHIRGSNLLLDELVRKLSVQPGETTEDKTFTLETVACLGACALAPVMTVNNKYYGKVTSKKLLQTLDKYREKASCVLGENK